MKRTYQSRRRKIHSKPLSQDQHSQHTTQAPAANNSIHKYYRKNQSKSPLKPLAKTKKSKNLARNRITTKFHQYSDNDSDSDSESESESDSDKDNGIIPFSLRSANIRHDCCNNSEDLSHTTSVLSALSLKHRKQKQIHTTKQIITNDVLTLDDICNDEIDISDQYFEPDSQWPSWVSKDMIQRANNMDSERKRKREKNTVNGSPPSKKQRSPHKKDEQIVYSTVRKNKKRARRRSSMTPIASLRTQRIHRLTRKSNTDLLFDVLLRDDSECKQLDSKVTFDDLNGLQSIGKIDSTQEKLCLYLLSMGADPLLLNRDGVNCVYIAMHYKHSFNVISAMINKCICINNGYDELNQTYIFAKHGILSLVDIALRIGETKTLRILLENDLMPTRHTIEHEPKIELFTFCKQKRMSALATRVLKEQLLEAVDNLDIDYVESIICHGVDIDIRMDTNKTVLYHLVQQPFDMFCELDAKDQFDTVVCLLENGANPNSLCNNKTPMLIYPLQRSGQWNIRVVDILLHYGANLKIKVGETNKSLYVYAKENCVCHKIEQIITNYYNNVRKGNKKVELKATANPTLRNVIKTKNVITKNYTRNRKTAK